MAHRDSAKAISESIDKTVVRPTYGKDAEVRPQLRKVLAQNTTVAFDVESLTAALTATSAAATHLDSSSSHVIGALVALVAAKTAQTSAADIVASRATSALTEERRDRNRERWIYRAKIAGGVLVGLVVGAIAHGIYSGTRQLLAIFALVAGAR